MRRNSCAWRVALVWWSALAAALPGCGRSVPENLADKTDSASAVHSSSGNAAPVKNTASASSNSPIIHSSVLAAKTKMPAIATDSVPPSPIGPGHFNGSRESIVSSSAGIRALVISPDGGYLAVTRQLNQRTGSLQIWDVSAARLISETIEPLGVTGVVFAPDSRSVAYGGGDRSVVLQVIPTGPVVRWPGHRLSILDLAFSPDGKRLASLAFDKRLILWDVGSATQIAESVLEDQHTASQVRFPFADQLWTWTEGGTLRWYGIQANSLVPAKPLKIAENIWLAATDGQNLYGLRADHSLHIVNAVTGQSLSKLPLGLSNEPAIAGGSRAGRKITAVAIANTSHDIAICFADGDLTLWKQGDPDAERALQKGARNVDHLVADAHGRFWAAHSMDGGLFVVDRDQPEMPLWLERPATAIGGPRPASRFNAQAQTIVCSPNSQTVVVSQISTGSTQRRITRRDVSDSSPCSALLAGRNGVTLCGTEAGTVELWNTDSTTPTSIPNSQKAITALAETPDDKFLLAGDADGTVTWVSLDSKRAVKSQHEQTARIRAAEVSPDGRWAATASDDHTIALWDVVTQSRTLTLKGHGHPVQAVAFTADSKWLVSGDRHGTVILWDVPAGTHRWTVTLAGPLIQAPTRPAARPEDTLPKIDSDRGISALKISRDQRVLAVGTVAGYTQTFDLTLGQELSAVFHRSAICDLAFADDGASLLVATLSGDVSRWWQAPAAPQLLSGHQGSVRFAALDASGQRAVTGGHDKRLCVWDVARGTMLQTLDNDGEVIVSGALSADGRRAVTGSFGSGVVFWDLAAMRRLTKRYGHGKRVRAFAFSPDGNWVASGCDDQTAKIWDFATQKAKLTIPHDAPVHFITFSPDGTKLLTSTIDPRGWQFPGRLRLWETVTGKPLNEFQGHRVVANAAVLSSDGSELFSCGADGQLCRWKMSNGERLHDSLRGDGLSHAGLIDGGRLLIMRRFNNGIIVHSTSSLTRLAEFGVPTRSIGDLGVATRANRMIAGTEEGPAYVWSLSHD